MNQDKTQNNQNSLRDFLEENQRKAEKKRRFSEYGKRGGRPRKIDKKKYIYSISLTEKQNLLAKKICEETEISLQEYLRRTIENSPLPNPERNKLLLKSYSNFKRIKNFFHAGIWNEVERIEFKNLIAHTCDELLKAIKK